MGVRQGLAVDERMSEYAARPMSNHISVPCVQADSGTTLFRGGLPKKIKAIIYLLHPRCKSHSFNQYECFVYLFIILLNKSTIQQINSERDYF